MTERKGGSDVGKYSVPYEITLILKSSKYMYSGCLYVLLEYCIICMKYNIKS